MKSLIQVSTDIDEVIAEFQAEKINNIANRNKAAGQRARKLSLRLGDLLKSFRAESVKAFK